MTDKALLQMFSINPLVQLLEPDSQLIYRANQLLYEEIRRPAPDKGAYVSLLKAVLSKFWPPRILTNFQTSIMKMR